MTLALKTWNLTASQHKAPAFITLWSGSLIFKVDASFLKKTLYCHGLEPQNSYPQPCLQPVPRTVYQGS
jgi:hypothetical protein